MKKIGIIAAHKENENIYDDYYKLSSLFIKKLVKNNIIPIIIVDKNQFNLCDGFIIPGGNKIDSICYEVIYYSIINNKPLLGICMGMQALCLYDLLYSRIGKYDLKLFQEEYNKLKNDKFIFLKQADDSHGGLLSSGELEATNENISNSKHEITLTKNSRLFDIYNSETINIISMHRYYCDFNLTLFNKFAYNNNVLEAIEYKDKNLFIVGVQYHIELEENEKLFNFFVKKINHNLL